MIIEGKLVASGWLSRKALCCLIHTIKGQDLFTLEHELPKH